MKSRAKLWVDRGVEGREKGDESERKKGELCYVSADNIRVWPAARIHHEDPHRKTV